MNEQQYRYLISKACVYARAISDEPIAVGRKTRAGKISAIHARGPAIAAHPWAKAVRVLF